MAITTGAQTREDLERDIAKWKKDLAPVEDTPELAHLAEQFKAWIAAGERLVHDLRGLG